METITFAHFKMFYNHPVAVLAFMRFGKKGITIHTDMQFNPLLDHPLYQEYMSEQDIRKVMSDLNFIEVKNGFDVHNIEDLKEIKSQISPDWIESYNAWAGYTG